jgi:hypothetical protein
MVLRRGNYFGPIDMVPMGVKVSLAISTRRMSRNYFGPCMLVRRGSDSATLDIPFCGNSICRSTLAAFCAGTTGFVRTWYDQSGNANHVEQSTAASQPTVFVSGDLVRDAYGNPRVNHTATGQIMTFDPTKVPTGSNPVTCFSVTRNNTSAGVRSRYSWGTNVASQYRAFETDNANLPRVNNGSTNAALSQSELNTPLAAACRFARGVNPGITIRGRYDDASNTVLSNSANPSTWATGTTVAKIWGRPADTTSVVGFSYEYMFTDTNMDDGIMIKIIQNLEEYYGFNR